jgi:peptide/nickel transport system permease protein
MSDIAKSLPAMTNNLAARPRGARRSHRLFAYIRRNPSLAIGAVLIGALLLFCAVGALTWDLQLARPLSAPAAEPPSWQHPFGSDNQGRDLFAVILAGTPLTLWIGLLAGFIGVAVGTLLAFVAGYYGGAVDAVVRGVVDVGLTVPGLLVLIIIAIAVRGSLAVEQMALVVALLAWLSPTRTIRSQVLSMRERGYIQIATFAGMSGPEIIFREMIPNLLPYLAASLVGATSSAVLASIGLEVLGLGPIDSPTIGMTIYWVIYNSALLLGMWWWFVPPVVVIVILFVGLFNLSVGLDELANPRLRKSA